MSKNSLNKRKTVTFGDASAVTGNKIWFVATIVVLIVAWVISAEAKLINPIFWPSPLKVIKSTYNVAIDGFRNFSLLEHIGWSIYRILLGFGAGCLVGIPIGFAMGLSNIMKSSLDPIVEFFRPVPPLAFIPLMIIWFGIDELSKVMLLFLAALWIMIIAAKSGVASVKLSKLHAAYSLGASKYQVLRYVILPNALPEIFIGMRVSMGVCWGTVVAAELVAAEKGVGFIIYAAQTFLKTDVVIMGIIIIGAIGYGIDIVMRVLEKKLIPWKGKG